MEIRVPVSEFSRALNIIHSVAHKKHTMAILSNVLLEARSEENAIYLNATDLDIGIRLKRTCEVLLAGETTVSAKALLDIVKMLPGPDVLLKSIENGRLSIKSGRTQAKLMALSASSFPQLPSEEGIYFQEVERDKFLSMLQRTIFSASVEENRANITGVYLEPQKDNGRGLVMVATDGHRLSRVKEIFPNGNFSEFSPVTLPKKGLGELIKLLEQHGDGPKTFNFGFSSQHAIFKIQESYLTMRLIEGQFPDYNQVIPRLADKILRASKHDFLLSVKRVAVLASEKNQSVKLKILNGDLTLSCHDPDTGEVTDDIPVEYNGPDIEIGFNARYLMEAIASIDDGNIMIKFTDSLSPTLITGLKDDNHLCVIMPMRINQ